MSTFRRYFGLAATIVTLVFGALPAMHTHQAQAQKPPAGQNPPQTGTIRIKVGLVQTDVMVFDGRGQFVPDLKLDQFELRVDGKVQPLSFVELVAVGSPHDKEVWAREEERSAPPVAQQATASDTVRTMLFFLDDWHMSADSVTRSRVALSNVLDSSIGPNDRVGIFTATGQFGPADQLTSDKTVLLARLEKFNVRSEGVQDLQFPPMTESSHCPESKIIAATDSGDR